MILTSWSGNTPCSYDPCPISSILWLLQSPAISPAHQASISQMLPLSPVLIIDKYLFAMPKTTTALTLVHTNPLPVLSEQIPASSCPPQWKVVCSSLLSAGMWAACCSAAPAETTEHALPSLHPAPQHMEHHIQPQNSHCPTIPQPFTQRTICIKPLRAQVDGKQTYLGNTCPTKH